MDCSICLDSNDECLLTHKCDHTFHINCMKRWLEEHNTCPNCRSEIEEDHDIFPDYRRRRHPSLIAMDSHFPRAQQAIGRAIRFSSNNSNVRVNSTDDTEQNAPAINVIGYRLINPNTGEAPVFQTPAVRLGTQQRGYQPFRIVVSEGSSAAEYIEGIERIFRTVSERDIEILGLTPRQNMEEVPVSQTPAVRLGTIQQRLVDSHKIILSGNSSTSNYIRSLHRTSEREMGISAPPKRETEPDLPNFRIIPNREAVQGPRFTYQVSPPSRQRFSQGRHYFTNIYQYPARRFQLFEEKYSDESLQAVSELFA